MSDYPYTEDEQQRNRILTHQDREIGSIVFDSPNEDCITESENVLRSLGYGQEVDDAQQASQSSVETWDLVIPSWEILCKEANEAIQGECSLTSLFTEEELIGNKEYIFKLNSDFNAIHNLDKTDILICALAGIISATIDILLVGIPGPSKEGVSAGPLSNHIRKYFENKFPPEKMEKLGQKEFVKTPYDAQDNRNTVIDVDGLSSYYHRLLSLGHDPVLGWIVGVIDIMKGQMTTIDKSGKIVVQVIESYSGRRETNLFKALAKQFLHLKSDLTTSMGLPAPLMGLFNLLQFGNIGEEEQTIAEVVQGMYYEGYDFIQFCSSSIPVMFTEVAVRISWAIRRLKNGYSIKESIPSSLNRDKHPKLASMLFLAHSAASAINAGKVLFTKNPMAINYPQWLAFSRYAFKQLKWWLWEKETKRDKYVMDLIDKEGNDILAMINKEFESFQPRLLIVGDSLVMN